MIIKDTIDMVLLHTEWIKENSKTRGDDFARKYGIGVSTVYAHSQNLAP